MRDYTDEEIELGITRMLNAIDKGVKLRPLLKHGMTRDETMTVILNTRIERARLLDDGEPECHDDYSPRDILVYEMGYRYGYRLGWDEPYPAKYDVEVYPEDSEEVDFRKTAEVMGYYDGQRAREMLFVVV